MAWLRVVSPRSGCAPVVLALLVTTACGSPPPPEQDEGSTSTADPGSTGSSGTATTTTTTGMPMTSGVDSTTYGPGCGPDPCPAKCGEGCESTATCLASVWMCECECPMTGTEGDGCSPLTEQLDAWVEPSKTPAVDCGMAGPDDDPRVWQTVHDCVVLSAAGSSFRALWTQPAGDDPRQYAAAARVGGRYELGWFQVSEPMTVIEYGCEAITATPDCTIDVGQMCLTCEGQTEIQVLCSEP